MGRGLAAVLWPQHVPKSWGSALASTKGNETVQSQKTKINPRTTGFMIARNQTAVHGNRRETALVPAVVSPVPKETWTRRPQPNQ